MCLNKVIAMLVGLLMCSSAFSATDDEIKQFEAWSVTFNQLGFHPTADEISQKAKTLHFNDAEIAAAIKTEFTEGNSKADNIIMSSGQVRAMYLTEATRASNSKSEAIVQMGLEIKKLLDEIRHEKDTRDVDGFAITNAKLKVLVEKIAERNRAERSN